MHIQSITIAGFRSFGPVPVKIDLVDTLTAVVGPNASGKTALLQALCKMFGVTRAQRTVCLNRNVRLGSWPCKNTSFPRKLVRSQDRSQATIAAISGLIPTMFMTRVRL